MCLDTACDIFLCNEKLFYILSWATSQFIQLRNFSVLFANDYTHSFSYSKCIQLRWKNSKITKILRLFAFSVYFLVFAHLNRTNLNRLQNPLCSLSLKPYWIRNELNFGEIGENHFIRIHFIIVSEI